MRFRLPLKITSRTSSITNAFVQAIIPRQTPSASEHARVLQILAIDPLAMTCAYCGDPAKHWDHLNPYVRNKRPSGYINNAHNLVPACGPCNTSKGGHQWEKWIFGDAVGSPKRRGIGDLSERAARIKQLETELKLTALPLEDFVDQSLWHDYWSKLQRIEELLVEAQAMADVLARQIESGLEKSV